MMHYEANTLPLSMLAKHEPLSQVHRILLPVGLGVLCVYVSATNSCSSIQQSAGSVEMGNVMGSYGYRDIRID